MKSIPDCIPDALNMTIATAKAVSDDGFIHRKVLLKVMAEIAENGDLGSNPADIYLQCWENASRALGVKDPYENEKARSDKSALGILRLLAEKNCVAPEGSALRQALRISYVGTMLDFGGLGRADVQDTLHAHCSGQPARDGMDALESAIEKVDSVMLVAHRAGEIALDRPLAEAMLKMGKKVYVAVAARPVFLMATEKDAANCCFPHEVTVVDPGTAMYGLVQERASSEFRELLAGVGLVIVKGDVHFCTMTPQRDAFFILKAREEEVAARLEIEPGDGAIVKMSASRE